LLWKRSRNSIWKRVLREEVTSQNALAVFEEFVHAVMEDGLVSLVPIEADVLNNSLRLGIEETITIYESAFIELAHKNKWGLLTSDERQRDISKKRYATVRVAYIK
jgi:predicted nucleic acid-binding protein